MNRLAGSLFCLSIIFFASCTGDPFYKTDRNFNSYILSIKESPITKFNEEGFIWEKENDIVTISDSTRSNTVELKYSAQIAFVDENYMGLISGLKIIDDGWQYLVSPTYSEFVILEKKDLSIVFKKRIYNRASRMKIVDQRLYFEYGKYPNLKYGYFNFTK